MTTEMILNVEPDLTNHLVYIRCNESFLFTVRFDANFKPLQFSIISDYNPDLIFESLMLTFTQIGCSLIQERKSHNSYPALWATIHNRIQSHTAKDLTHALN